MVDGVHLHLQQGQRDGVERRGQGPGERLQLGLDMGCQAGQDSARRASGEQSLEDAPSVDAEQVRQDAAEPQAVVVERLVDAVAVPAALADELATIAGQLPHVAEVPRGHVARLGETELADAGQPQAIVDIGLLAADLLDVLGVEQRGADAGVCRAPRTGPSSTPRCLPSPPR